MTEDHRNPQGRDRCEVEGCPNSAAGHETARMCWSHEGNWIDDAAYHRGVAAERERIVGLLTAEANALIAKSQGVAAHELFTFAAKLTDDAKPSVVLRGAAEHAVSEWRAHKPKLREELYREMREAADALTDKDTEHPWWRTYGKALAVLRAIGGGT